MNNIILSIYSEYFALSDWFQSPGQFFKTNWRLPYLEDVDNIISIRWYSCLETRLIDGIFA